MINRIVDKTSTGMDTLVQSVIKATVHRLYTFGQLLGVDGGSLARDILVEYMSGNA